MTIGSAVVVIFQRLKAVVAASAVFSIFSDFGNFGRAVNFVVMVMTLSAHDKKIGGNVALVFMLL